MISGRLRRLGALALGAATAGSALGAYARCVEPRRFESVTLSLTLPRWPKALDGFLLALVGDIHEGAKEGRPWSTPSLGAAIGAIRDARPDALVLAGDFVFGQWDPVRVAATVAAFEAPLRVAVLGNHDYGRGQTAANQLAVALQDVGYIVLHNQTRRFLVRDVPVWFCGLGDTATNHVDVDLALSELPEGAAPVIAITHVPDLAEQLPEGRFDLIVSGHSHGGQIALPWINRWTLLHGPGTRYDRGLYTVNGTPLYVSKGLGMVGYHARFRARPEAVFLRLHAPGYRMCEVHVQAR